MDSAPGVVFSRQMAGLAESTGEHFKDREAVVGTDPASSRSSPLEAAEACSLRFESVCKDYPSGRVVDDVSFEVLPGEIHALVGENGAGKSTIIKMAAGVVHQGSGTVYIGDKPAHLPTAVDARKAGVSVVFQEINVVPYFDAPENIFLGQPYPRTRLGTVNYRELKRRAAQVLDSLETEVPLNVPVMDLSPSARAMIAIARAVILESSILILDEPTASLSLTETNHLFDVLKKLKERGTAILYVSHRLQEILEIADRITILRDGKLIATIPAQGTTVDHIIELMIGRSLKQLYPDRTSNFGEPLLEVEDLSGPGVNNLSFTLHRGEILGVGGLGGSGRSELLKLLVGATQRSSGTVTLGGKAFHPTHPADAFAVGMPLVPEERRAEGLILPLTVGENLVLSHLSHLAYGGLVMRGPKEKSLVKRLIKMLGVKTSGGGQPITELSGGNQQKVVFGKCLASEDVSVLMLDEPTRGVDVGSKAEIYDIVRKVADEGKGVLLVSSDLPELLGLSDRVLLLARDRTAKVFPASELDERTYLNYCMGGASE